MFYMTCSIVFWFPEAKQKILKEISLFLNRVNNFFSKIISKICEQSNYLQFLRIVQK